MSKKSARHVYRINGLGEITLEIPQLDFADVASVSDSIIGPLVKSSADMVRARAQAMAPKKSGDLVRGIIVNPMREHSMNPHKVVHDVVIDANMNDTFVKMSRDGKRYYYPASQEYGFRIGNGKRVPGRYYMRDAAVETAAEHRDRVADGVGKILEEL